MNRIRFLRSSHKFSCICEADVFISSFNSRGRSIGFTAQPLGFTAQPSLREPEILITTVGTIGLTDCVSNPCTFSAVSAARNRVLSQSADSIKNDIVSRRSSTESREDFNFSERDFSEDGEGREERRDFIFSGEARIFSLETAGVSAGILIGAVSGAVSGALTPRAGKIRFSDVSRSGAGRCVSGRIII